mmetsp:Transcript_16488/g.52550  ORF Transcript_16488/g.52550 Transcript_16488/m.52550 type:complete len:273 (-) Transcript_16488:424-1242(-)
MKERHQLQQLEEAGDFVHLVGRARSKRNYRKATTGDFSSASVPDGRGGQPASLGVLDEGNELGVAGRLADDERLARLRPETEQAGVAVHEPAVERERGVAHLRGNLAAAHAELLVDHHHHLVGLGPVRSQGEVLEVGVGAAGAAAIRLVRVGQEPVDHELATGAGGGGAARGQVRVVDLGGREAHAERLGSQLVRAGDVREQALVHGVDKGAEERELGIEGHSVELGDVDEEGVLVLGEARVVDVVADEAARIVGDGNLLKALREKIVAERL